LNTQSDFDAPLESLQQSHKKGPAINSVLELNPEVRQIANALDAERANKGPRGPLHGIPVLLKDNIDTGDKMMTTAGSLALVGSPATRDATVVKRLREAGAIIFGKTNMSEWANFRGFPSTSGWSARGGLTRNPYILDHNPCGSSSGSAAATAANFCAAALGTETDGSIVAPASICGVVGVKPTVGLTSRAGVIPISHTQDTIGPLTRTVADAAAVLSVIAGADPLDPATQKNADQTAVDYTKFLDNTGLRGARIGIPRRVYYGYNAPADKIAEMAIKSLKDADAVVIDPADIPTASQLNSDRSEFTVLLYEFKASINTYLASRPGVQVRSLNDLIKFNDENADQELLYWGQQYFIAAQQLGPLTETAYLRALETNQRLARKDGIDAVMDRLQLDALVAPTVHPAWVTDLILGDRFLGSSAKPAAAAGYPAISVPAGFVFGLPVGITFMGRAFSEAKLLKLAYAYEQATKLRRSSEFMPNIKT